MWTHASLFRRFTNTNVHETGSVKIRKTRHEISVDILVLQCTPSPQTSPARTFLGNTWREYAYMCVYIKPAGASPRRGGNIRGLKPHKYRICTNWWEISVIPPLSDTFSHHVVLKLFGLSNRTKIYIFRPKCHISKLLWDKAPRPPYRGGVLQTQPP